MGRQRTRARNAKNGLPNTNFNSKTSPSAVKARLAKKERGKVKRVYPRRHVKRTALKSSLARQYGLPPDTLFIFRRPTSEDGKDEHRDTVMINQGTVVVINSVDLSVVLVVRCTPFATMSHDLRKRFNHSFSTSYLHARARTKDTQQTSVAPFEEAREFPGWMGYCSWRGASEKGLSLGTSSSINIRCLPNNS